MEASAYTPGRSIPRTARVPVPPRVLRVLSDEALVAHVRRGHDAAFEVIFDRHHRRILSFCRHMLGRPEEAEDAVQQAFLSAYDALRADDREIQLRPWLYAIARNTSLSLLRARRDGVALDEELHRPAVDGLADEVQRRDDLRSLVGDLADLPDDQRAALVLAELGDLSHPEIAGVVGCEPEKVKALVFQARERLLAARQAREADCQEIQEVLATATGGVLRRGPIRRHLKVCPSCAAFREDVKRQRAALACVLPVVPSLALKQASLPSAILASGTAGGAAAGAGMLGAGGTKIASVVAAGVVSTGGGFAAVEAVKRHEQAATKPSAPVSAPAATHRHVPPAAPRWRSPALRDHATMSSPARHGERATKAHERPTTPAASNGTSGAADAKPTTSAADAQLTGAAPGQSDTSGTTRTDQGSAQGDTKGSSRSDQGSHGGGNENGTAKTSPNANANPNAGGGRDQAGSANGDAAGGGRGSSGAKVNTESGAAARGQGGGNSQGAANGRGQGNGPVKKLVGALSGGRSK